jgi:mannan endo-1,4-beta-mannosidase
MKNFIESHKLKNIKMLKFILTLFLINQIAGDLVTYVDYGGKVPTDDRFDVLFKYDADGARDCEISLKKPTENWKTYAYKKISCGVGKGVAKALTLTYITNPVAGTGYVVEVKITNAGVQTAYMTYNVVVENGKQGFHTYQGKLYDANKSVFTIRGVNNAHGDYDGSGGGTGGKRWLAFNALRHIALHKSNTVRILWRTNNDLSSVDLDKVIAEAIAQKLVPIIEMHDATGSDKPADLHAMARFIANNVWLLVKYRKYIIVNIANEWSPWGYAIASWRDAYKTAIQIIRDAGYSGTLVVDASAYAQNPNSIKSHGGELVTADTYRNLVFSLHMYAEWSRQQPNYNIVTELQAIKNLNLPLLVGEFADKHPAHINGKCVNADIDAKIIMSECQKHGFGYLAWSWAGNGVDASCGDIKYLDMVNLLKWDASSGFGTWGNLVLNEPGSGIKASAVKASVFP